MLCKIIFFIGLITVLSVFGIILAVIMYSLCSFVNFWIEKESKEISDLKDDNIS